MSGMQVHGLTDKALEIVGATIPVKVTRTLHFPCGGVKVVEGTVQLPALEKVPLSRVKLSNDEHVELSRYRGHDGVFYDEFVQAERWGCDLHVFVALKDSRGTPVAQSLRQESELAVEGACYCRHTC